MFLSLIALIACRAELPTETNDIVGHDPEYGTAEVVIPGDVPEDTGENDPEIICAFPTLAWRTGEAIEVVLANEFRVSLNQGTPSGQKDPGWNEVLRLDYTVVHPECPAMSPSWHVISAVASDNEDTNWLQGVVDTGIYGYDADGAWVTGWDARSAPDIGEANNYNFGLSPFMPWIQGGETLTVSYFADLENPSVGWDDSIQFGFQVDQLGIYDGVINANLFVEAIPGGTIVF